MASRAQQAPSGPHLLRVDPGIGWRIRRFLGSRGHIMGALLTIGGLILLDAGLIHGLIAAGVIVGLYAIGYFVGTRPQLSGTVNLGAAPARDADKIAAGLDEMLATVRKRVAADIYQRVVSIRDAVVFILNHVGDEQTDPGVYAVRQTAATYLPEALSKYLALPRPYAERQLIANGKTSHDILLEQLVIMETKAHEVAEAVIARDSQRLVTHGRFIADRFGDSNLDAAIDEPTVVDSVPVGQPTAARDVPQAAPAEPVHEKVRLR